MAPGLKFATTTILRAGIVLVGAIAAYLLLPASHGGGPNSTDDEWRLGVNVQYCPGFVRQQQNPYLSIPPS